jgi:hypothetical protein
MFEDGYMYSGNANAEKECLTVEAMINPGLRVSMMRPTCNLPSRPSKIIAYPYKGCNRSTCLKSVSNYAHSARVVELFRALMRLIFQEACGYSVQPKAGVWAFIANLLNFRGKVLTSLTKSGKSSTVRYNLGYKMDLSVFGELG